MHTLVMGAVATMVMNSEPPPSVPPSYPRVRAPVYFTRAGTCCLFLKTRRRPTERSLGGLRVYTDEKTKVGTRLELEIFLPDGTSVVCKTEVAWVESLTAGAPAGSDVGRSIIAIHPHDRERLSTVLEFGKNDVPL
jgi:hypothetical protein